VRGRFVVAVAITITIAVPITITVAIAITSLALGLRVSLAVVGAAREREHAWREQEGQGERVRKCRGVFHWNAPEPGVGGPKHTQDPTLRSALRSPRAHTSALARPIAA
jgi:hypothetical protein